MFFNIILFILLNSAILLTGLVCIRRKMVLQSWAMLIVGISLIHFIFLHEDSIIRMLAIIATTFSGMKVIAVTSDYKDRSRVIQFNTWLRFALGWAGMRIQPFENPSTTPLPGAWRMIWFGVSRIATGVLFIFLAHNLVLLPINQTLNDILINVILLIGFSLLLHFGVLSISAGVWRLRGVNTYLLFNQPLKSISLTEFWSKRWNIAFSEMTSIAIVRPLKNKIGNTGTLIAAFLFSGLLHELALSLPVNSGYGLPMLYFVIQGILVLVEKTLISCRLLFLQHKIVGWVWTFFWVVAPSPLLFHAQFMKEVVWKLAGM